MPDHRHTFTGILLAAGRGSRFDASGRQDKLLQSLPTGDAVVAASAKNLLAVLPKVVAVVRPGAENVAARLQALGCEVTVCATAEQGMGASLVHALSLASDAAGWLVALGDMPFVRQETLQTLVSALQQGAGIVAPLYRGRRGNPVGFNRSYLPQLLELGGDQGARRLLQQFPVTEIPVNDPGVALDIDMPADLAAQG
ncbi:MAG: nucleotidyltransferase family protein [Bacillota bacterium]